MCGCCPFPVSAQEQHESNRWTGCLAVHVDAAYSTKPQLQHNKKAIDSISSRAKFNSFQDCIINVDSCVVDSVKDGQFGVLLSCYLNRTKELISYGIQGRENETEQARQRRILADRERKRLARSCETPEMKQKRNEADKIRKRLVRYCQSVESCISLLAYYYILCQMRGMETPEAKRRRREAEKQRRAAARASQAEHMQHKAPMVGEGMMGGMHVKPSPIICGIPLCQGGIVCEGKEVVPPEVSLVAMKQFPSTIQKLPLLLRQEMKPLEHAVHVSNQSYGMNNTIPL